MNSGAPSLMTAPPGGSISTFSARDGARLRYGAWPSAGIEPQGTVLLLHGRTEFIEKHFETIADLCARGYSVFTLDWRGQGLSDALDGEPLKGHVNDYRDYLDDLDLFVRTVVTADGVVPEPFILLGHSMGAHVGLRYCHDHPDKVARAVFCAPLIKIEARRIPGAFSTIAARVISALGFHTSYIPGRAAYWAARQNFDGNPLTSDVRRYQIAADWIDRNPNLAVGPPTIGWLSSMFRSFAVIHRAAYVAAIPTPILMIAAGRDSVVSTDSIREYCDQLASAEFLLMSDAQHEILHERDELRNVFWDAFDRFVVPPTTDSHSAG